MHHDKQQKLSRTGRSRARLSAMLGVAAVLGVAGAPAASADGRVGIAILPPQPVMSPPQAYIPPPFVPGYPPPVTGAQPVAPAPPQTTYFTPPQVVPFIVRGESGQRR